MIMADKIIKLRKQNGWSQEELADRLGVSRQAVSKWEGGNAIPDLEKIVNMSALFGVSTDYLLKDEIETASPSETDDSKYEDSDRHVSVEEANGFMDMTESLSRKMAIGVQMCVLGPAFLVFMAAVTEMKTAHISDETAMGIGMSVLLIIVAGGVGLLISAGLKLKRYEYIKTDGIKLEYGVAGIVKKKKEEFEKSYHNGVVIGVILCIASVIPLMISLMSGNDILTVACTSILLIMVSFGVHIFVRVGTIENTYKALLQEEDFSYESKIVEKKLDLFYPVYWCAWTALYLGVSFWFNNWDRSWIIWPVAGVLFVVVRGILASRVKTK